MNKQTGCETARAVERFMQGHREGRFAADALDIIIDEALAHDLEKARAGTNNFFTRVIEPLSDTFLLKDRNTLQKVLAHLISRLRLLPEANRLHRQLNRWNLKNEPDLLNRMEHLSSNKKFDSASSGKIKKIFILSRVTLGADVLLNIPVIEKMKKVFPGAEIVFLGSRKNGTLLGGNRPGFRIYPLRYDRRGVLSDRFLIWIEVIGAVASEIDALVPDRDYIIVNTDSRLLQSGLLPVISPADEDRRYFSWRPSVNHEEWQGTSQAEDLLQWLDTTFDCVPKGEKIYPGLYLSPQDHDFAHKVFDLIPPAGKRFVVSMSWGVGGNEAKRVKSGDETLSQFESGLVQKLLSDGAVLILDRGYGTKEFQQAGAIMQAAMDRGFEIAEVIEKDSGSMDIKCSKAKFTGVGGLIVFQGTINKFAALIDLSDGYIGYDSLGQHLAAALGRDVIAIFAGYHSELFPERWKPMGSGRIRLVKARCGPFAPDCQDKLAGEVFELYRSMRRNDPRGK